MQLNAGISFVLHFTMDVGQCLFSPLFLQPDFLSRFCSPLFVWSSGEMKMIITHYGSKKLMKM